jgi:hypothetical protein
MPRRLLKFISAFLFAMVAAVGVHVGFWIVMADLAQEKLIGSINRTDGFRIEVAEIRKTGYPEHINLDMSGVRLHWQDRATNQRLSLSMPHMTVRTDFLAQQRVEIAFDKHQTLTHEKDGKVSEFLVMIEGPELLMFQQPGSHEIHARFRTLTVRDKQTDATVLKTAETFVSREAADFAARNWNIRITANRVTVDDAEGEATTYNAANLDVNATAFPPRLFGDFLVWLFQPERRAEYAETLLGGIAAARSGFELNELLLDRSDFWLSLRTQFQLDSRLRPDGVLTMTTNQPEKVIDYLRNRQMINDIALQQNRYIHRLMNNDEERVTLRFQCTGGNLSLQGAPVGVVPPITEWTGRG